MKLSRFFQVGWILGLCLAGLASGQQPAAPAPAPAVTPAPLAPLPPVEVLAEEAQSRLFKAADQTARPSPSGRKTTFTPPKTDDPSGWSKDSVHQLAVMEVSFGGTAETVMFELFPQDAPRTVANFIDNCESGSYKGVAFHRAIEGFLVQTGDPLSKDEAARDRWGTGGEDKTVPAEIKRSHRKGSVAMGRRNDKVNPSRRSNGYQFYFALGNAGSLDGQYSVFGQVVSGMDVLEKISRMPVDSNECPIARIEVESIKVVDHTGPLNESSGEGRSKRRYSKPAAAKGFFERFLERVW